jgi:hypothetical protein
MAQRLGKKMLGGGELPENSYAIEYFLSPLVAGGGEVPEQSFASEYVESLAPDGSSAFGGGPDDYGIWTSVPERKKKAA